MTHILISFCNSTSGAPSLALVNAADGAVDVLRVPPPLAAHDIAGIAVSERYVFAAARAKSTGRARGPAQPSRLFVLNRRDLTLAASYECRSVFDAHSLHLGDDLVDVVSTGTDEVVRLRLRGPEVIAEELLWRPDGSGPRADLHHLNAIATWQGELVVSGFGRKRGQLWSSARDGFIECITTGERLASGIRQPHSLTPLGDDLAYCESSTGNIRLLRGSVVWSVPGYARGLCLAGDALFVGLSQGRRTSKSTGALTNRGDPGKPGGRCALVKLRLDAPEIAQIIDLSLLNWEIYDVWAVSDVEHWPVDGELEWRDRMVAGMRADFEERDEAVSWLHTEVAGRDAAVERLHAEVALRSDAINALHADVAGRDRIVEELHGTVAGRDQAIDDLHRGVAGRDQAIEELHRGVSGRDRTIEALHADVSHRDRGILALHEDVAERDRTIAWLHLEVANRDHTVGCLHREVAERDRLIERLRSALPEVSDEKADQSAVS